VNFDGLRYGVGLALVLLGLVHFVDRDHDPDQRSYFTGGIRLGYRVRVLFALTEMAFGGVLLLAKF